jgi:hypothetical protein
MPVDLDTNCHIDMVGSGSEHDLDVYLRYFANEGFRQNWKKDFPEDTIPPHETPPYDRDRHLPRCER